MALKSAVSFIVFWAGIILAENPGDYFFKHQSYYDAITEYKRILFFKDYDSKDEVTYKMASAYYHLGNAKTAEKILLEMTIENNSNEYYSKALGLLAQIQWDSYNYVALRAVLDRLSLELDISGKQQIEYIKAWTYLYQAQWDTGVGILKELDNPDYHPLIDDLSHINDVPQKSTIVAGWLSRIIPGSGQLYNGDYENAWYSFLLVGSIGTSMIWDIYQKAYFTGLVKYLFLYTRYSKGSIYQMVSDIERSNIDFIGNFLKTVSDKYPKPMRVLEELTS